jgi:hypothetical protein
VEPLWDVYLTDKILQNADVYLYLSFFAAKKIYHFQLQEWNIRSLPFFGFKKIEFNTKKVSAETEREQQLSESWGKFYKTFQL